jgi:hypothetical protein
MGVLTLLLRIVLLFVVLSLLGRWLRNVLSGQGAERKPAKDTGTKLELCAVCNQYLTAKSPPCERQDCPRQTRSASALVFLLMAFLGWATPAGAEEAGGRYLVQTSGQNVEVRLFVNDIPVERWRIAEQSAAGTSINHWIRQGANSVKVTAVALNGQAQSSFQVRAWFLGLSAAGGMNEVDILRQEGIPPSAEGTEVVFNVPSAPQLSIWTIESEPPDNAAILAKTGEFIEKAAAVIQSGSSLSAIDSLAFERQDISRAYGSSATLQQLDINGEIGHDAIKVSGRIAPDNLEVLPLGQSGLARVVRRDGKPLFVAMRGGDSFSIHAVLAGKIGGQWRILRRCY